MKHLDSIPHTLNGIFRELNKATNITVTLSPTSNPASGIRHPAFTIRDFNGCQSSDQYYHLLLNLCAGVKLAIVDALPNFDPSEKGVLLLEAFNRADTLLQKITTTILPAKPVESEPSGYLFLKIFTHVVIHAANKKTKPPSSDNRALLIQLHPFACQLKKSLRILSNQLISLAILLQHHQDICAGNTNPPSPVQHKLRVRGSVPQIAAFGRMLYDDNLFDIRNKSEFCRIFSSFISTIQQDEISWHSYKNHFNCPSPETLSFWDTKISDWRKYIRKLSVLN